MKIPIEIGKLKKCKDCNHKHCHPYKFKFNFSTFEIDCYGVFKWIDAEYWHKNDDKFYRDNGPACINYYENGKIRSKAWYKNSKFIREKVYENPI